MGKGLNNNGGKVFDLLIFILNHCVCLFTGKDVSDKYHHAARLLIRVSMAIGGVRRKSGEACEDPCGDLH